MILLPCLGYFLKFHSVNFSNFAVTRESTNFIRGIFLLELFFKLFCVFYGVGMDIVVEIDVDATGFFGLVFEPFGPVL